MYMDVTGISESGWFVSAKSIPVMSEEKTSLSQSDNLPKQYQPSEVEGKWNEFWEQQGFFHSEPDHREPFTVVIPPPNVTGVLHMGHMLNNTIQDVLVRRARMLGKNACWVPGTDHASIATEAKVVQRLRKSGIKKSDLSRDEFLKHAWDWTHEHGGIILQQLRKLGASCDWQRTRFTLEEELSFAVRDCFIDLYDRGLIYRGLRMINWDPAALTALSDEEVIYKDGQSKLYFVRYPVVESDQESPGNTITQEYVIIATTRPETILADTAVAVNPNDTRYQHLVGKQVRVPFSNRIIPVITDEYVDQEYGTGCLKVTPAHDPNDYEIGLKHGLEILDMLTEDAMVALPNTPFSGLDRFEARKKMVIALEEEGFLVKTEEISNSVGYSERTDVVIEPRLSLQWFLRMEELAKPALENVLNGEIRFHPEKFVHTYQHWMENIKDWCISRQLWWGHRIPAWYFGSGEHDYVIAVNEEEAATKATQKAGRPVTLEELRQDEDVLDTWFSSWLWPISVFDGFKDPKNRDVQYYYPTQDLVTAPEIMFFWVARMIMAGYAFRGEKPFSDVYYHGIVRDKQRRKMSKSLGNSPDPLDLIAQYGADGTRVGMLFSSPAGNDLLFDEALCEQGRNFANKIWNAFRFLMLNRDPAVEHSFRPVLDLQPQSVADAWMATRILGAIEDMNRNFDEYRLNDALKTIYALIWDDYCDWYIELIKPDTPGVAIDNDQLQRAFGYFEVLMKLLHPFMPFLSEEIWSRIHDRTPHEALTISLWPDTFSPPMDEESMKQFASMQHMITSVRNTQAELNLSPRKPIHILIKTSSEEDTKQLSSFSWMLNAILAAPTVEISERMDRPKGSRNLLIGSYEMYIPLEGLIDVQSERQRITDEIARLKSFQKNVEGKLSNAQFVDNAPEEVVQKERQKLADTSDSLEKLQAMLAELS